MSSDGRATELAEVMRAGKPVVATISVTAFRDLYHSVSAPGQEHLRWIIVLLGEQAFAQPHGNPRIFLTIAESPPRFYSSTDFPFVDPTADQLLGSTDGRYQFVTFLRDVIRWEGIVRFAYLGTISGLALYDWGTPAVQRSLASSLLSALSLFVTIFVLFVLTIEPEKEAGYLLNGRFRKLISADKYIASCGLTALVLSVGYAVVSAALSADPSNASQIAVSIWGGVTILASVASFQLVIGYHFSRRHEMTEIRMARALLRDIQGRPRASGIDLGRTPSDHDTVGQ